MVATPKSCFLLPFWKVAQEAKGEAEGSQREIPKQAMRDPRVEWGWIDVCGSKATLATFLEARVAIYQRPMLII